jgi:hypothetical protein
MMRSTKHFFMRGSDTTIFESRESVRNQPHSNAVIKYLQERLEAKRAPWSNWIMKKKVAHPV